LLAGLYGDNSGASLAGVALGLVSSADSSSSCTGPRLLMRTLLSFQELAWPGRAFPGLGHLSRRTGTDLLIKRPRRSSRCRDSIVVLAQAQRGLVVCVNHGQLLSLMLGMGLPRALRGSTPLFYLVLLSLMTPGPPASLAGHDAADVVTSAATSGHLHDGAARVQVVWALPFGFLVMLTVFKPPTTLRAEEGGRAISGRGAIRTFPRGPPCRSSWVGVFSGAALFGFHAWPGTKFRGAPIS